MHKLTDAQTSPQAPALALAAVDGGSPARPVTRARSLTIVRGDAS